jgi:hypothetical protein
VSSGSTSLIGCPGVNIYFLSGKQLINAARHVRTLDFFLKFFSIDQNCASNQF